MFNSVVVGILILHTVIGTAVKQEAYATGESAITNYKDHIDRGFTARKAVIRGNYIGFEKLIHDINVGPNNFNLDYGFFKAEKSGMHHFTFQFISTQREHFRVSLRLNGRPQVWALAQRNHQQVGNSATLSLNAGDVVYLYLEEGAIFEPQNSYRGYGTFSGHRITYDEDEAVVPRILSSRVGAEEKKDLDDYKLNYPSAW